MSVYGEIFTGVNGGECVNYARIQTGNNYTTSPALGANGGAYLIYGKWDYGQGEGPVPAIGSLIVIGTTSSLKTGHVGIVRSVSSEGPGIYELRVDESNWYLDQNVTTNTRYRYDLNNMTTRREFTPASSRTGTQYSPLGATSYPVRGFVHTKHIEIVTFNGLYWQQIDDGVGRSWYEAEDYCKKLTLDGSTNWRLPTREELNQTIACDNGKPPDEAGDWSCNDPITYYTPPPKINQIFSCSPGAYTYWTSTQDERYSNSEDSAYVVEYSYGYSSVSFIKGYEFPNQTFSSLFTRCVSSRSIQAAIDLLLRE